MQYHFSESVTQRVNEIIEPFKRSDEWAALEIPGQPLPSACILFKGMPGTGKSTLAREILKKVSGLPKASIPEISMGEVGSGKLGETEKLIMHGFTQALARCKSTARPMGKVPVLFIDECDGIVWSRGRVTDNTMFMLSIVNTLLTQIDKFLEAGGCICFATNFAEFLDPAFVRRLTDIIILTPPIGRDAEKVWQSRMPLPPFGFEITEEICNLGWTPNDIEKYVLTEARRAFLTKTQMCPPKL